MREGCRVALSGTPGTGKTTISRLLHSEGFDVLSMEKIAEKGTRRARVQSRLRRLSGEPHHVPADTDPRRERLGNLAQRHDRLLRGIGRHRQFRRLGFHQSQVLVRTQFHHELDGPSVRPFDYSTGRRRWHLFRLSQLQR